MNAPPDAMVQHVQRIDDLIPRFLPFGSVVVDRDHRIVMIDAAAQQLLGGTQ